MINGQKVVVVMPAYNAEATLRKTYDETVELDIVDLIIVVDDASTDNTLTVASQLSKTIVFKHDSNRGYGANQKTCYDLALQNNANIIIMVHPDYQYTPKLIPAIAWLLMAGFHQCVLGSRILGGKAMKYGMPWWKYISNRFLTVIENLITGAKLSEYHTGYRGFTRELLQKMPYHDNSDGFIFDNEMLLQIIGAGYEIGEISCPAKYFPEASSVNFISSLHYGFLCIHRAILFFFLRAGIIQKSRRLSLPSVR